MRKNVLTIFIVLFSLSLYSQSINGFIVKGADTNYVNFSLPKYFITGKVNSDIIQDKLKYFDVNGKKVIIKPGEVDEITFYFKGDTIHLISHIDPVQVPCKMCKTRYVFLNLLVDGSVRLFKYMKENNQAYIRAISSGGLNTGEEIGGMTLEKDYWFYYLKEGRELFSPNNMLFKKEMSKYFSDCEVLVRKINAKEFKKKDAIKIVEFYNTNCGK